MRKLSIWWNQRRLRVVLGLLVGAFLVDTPSTSHADDFTWNRSGNNSWKNKINWLPNSGYPRLASDTATFNLNTATASATPALNESVTINKLTVNQASDETNYGLTVNPGTPASSELNFGAASGNAVYLENANASPGTGETLLNSIVRLNASLDATVQGQLTFANFLTGAGGLNISGPGRVILTGDNSYGDGIGTVVNVGSTLVASNSVGSATGTGPVVVHGTLGGAGFVGAVGGAANVAVQSGGRINPGAVAGIGQLTIASDVTFGAGSFLDLNLESLGFDKLSVGGAAAIGGALNLTLPEDFIAAPGTTYEILTAGSGVTGTFTEIISSTGNAWSVEYGANSVTLVAGSGGVVDYAADFDLDGDVDGDDLTRWKDHFGLTTGAAKEQGDANNDGVVDGADFLAWQRHFGSGVIPTGGSAVAATPEPAGLVLILAVTTASLPFRRRIVRRTSLAANGETLPSA